MRVLKPAAILKPAVVAFALTAAGEFEQYVPFDLEEMQLDYQILGEEAKVILV